MDAKDKLLPALRRYWGYDAFRPLQERVIGSLLGGHDVCVVMPTGGGKSLCYQLPAAISETQTVVVVSPLIALMHDQVTQLTAMGLSAAFLNSSLPHPEQADIMQRAARGEYRLVYVSPERLARQDTFEWLKRVPVSIFAIDEAHCISEWGHEFRPDYRQLKRLREQFPQRPIAAFTASATQRVRHDIIDQLGLREPHKFIASFHRPNLRYWIKECTGEFEQMEHLTTALRAHAAGNVIVYAPTIKRVERTADELVAQGIPAVPYHARLSADVRRQHQERWMTDEVRVLVGTIAFGLGINKAAVRAVIHLALPKSVEQYYQEAGRAGRDGLPADCLLLWQPRDYGLHAHFIGQIMDEAEKQRSWQRYREIQDFVSQSRCRHRQICLHFGETPRWTRCDACDVCSGFPAWLKDIAPAPPKSDRGRLRTSRSQIMTTTSSRAAPISSALSATPVDDELREYLRQWRRQIAKDQGVAAFVVLHDTTLDELCRARPATMAELRSITGIGERKLATYGRGLLAAIARFQAGARASAESAPVSMPAAETLQLLQEGHTLDEIARLRNRTVGTVAETVAALIERGEAALPPGFIAEEKCRAIEAACARLGLQGLRPLKDALPDDITFDELRVVVAELKRKASAASAAKR
jgi:ATP-dependent DNA helicase RecQ